MSSTFTTITTERASAAYFTKTSIPEWDLVGFLDFVDHLDLYSKLKRRSEWNSRYFNTLSGMLALEVPLAKRNRAIFLLEKLHSRRACDAAFQWNPTRSRSNLGKRSRTESEGDPPFNGENLDAEASMIRTIKISWGRN